MPNRSALMPPVSTTYCSPMHTWIIVVVCRCWPKEDFAARSLQRQPRVSWRDWSCWMRLTCMRKTRAIVLDDRLHLYRLRRAARRHRLAVRARPDHGGDADAVLDGDLLLRFGCGELGLSHRERNLPARKS